MTSLFPFDDRYMIRKGDWKYVTYGTGKEVGGGIELMVDQPAPCFFSRSRFTLTRCVLYRR